MSTEILVVLSSIIGVAPDRLWRPECIPFRNFHFYCSVCVILGMRHPHIILLGLCQFCENRRREGRTFVKSVSASACTDVPVHRAAVWALRLGVYGVQSGL
jgi:hypothetical protein